jgi:hypothetical protein
VVDQYPECGCGAKTAIRTPLQVSRSRDRALSAGASVRRSSTTLPNRQPRSPGNNLAVRPGIGSREGKIDLQSDRDSSLPREAGDPIRGGLPHAGRSQSGYQVLAQKVALVWLTPTDGHRTERRLWVSQPYKTMSRSQRPDRELLDTQLHLFCCPN